MLRCVLRTVLLLPFVLPALAFAADDKISLELNTAETVNNQCRLTFVIENKNESAIDTFKLDLVVFNRENRMYRRNLVEMGRCGLLKRSSNSTRSTAPARRSARFLSMMSPPALRPSLKSASTT